MQRAAFPEAQLRPPAAAAAHLRCVLSALLADPDRPIAEVDILPPDERDRLIAQGRGPSVPVEIDILPAAFERHAALRGDATAVLFGSRSVSYSALNRDANRLARRLRGLGVAQNDRVGVFLDRSPEMVAAVLAVLKAGAGYVPLDTSYPPERLRFMIEDCAMRVIMTSRDARDRLNSCVPSGNAPVLLCVDAELALAGESDADLGLPVGGDDLAYVIYTSGSTGRPKGVEIPRRAMANFLQAMRDGDWIDPADTLLVVAPLAFDAHVSHIHHPLVVGARVLLAPREDMMDARRLISLLDEHHVTAMGATPTTWRMLLDAGWSGKPDLKLHCGGEALTLDLVQKLRPRVAALWNVYGPTETTVLSLQHRVELSESVIPVGRPLANTQVYVVDPSGRDVPEGVIGELLIGGEGLARGYLNRPDLTAEKFVMRPEGRVYRTGDLARFLPGGSLEVMGRLDHQVKIRGYRIELGEIEAELERHPAVAQAAVVVREEAPGDRRLAAYVVGAGAGRPITPAELRSFLQGRLPAFMVPASFAALEKLPLSSNGKVDRGALSALPAPALDERTPLPARPLDLLEYQLEQLFEEVLGVARVGPDDSFFEVGGSSLLAVRVLARIETILGKSVSMQAFFSAPTVTRLAELLRSDGWAPSLDTLVPLQPRGSEPPFFCVHAFIGDVCRGLAGRFTFGHPFYGLQPRGLDGREPPLESVEQMAAYYVEQLRRVTPRGPYFIGGYCFGGVVAFEMARQIQRAGDEVAMVAMIDAAPANIPRRSLRSKLRAAVNRGLYALEKVSDIPRSPDPAAEVRKIITRVAARASLGDRSGGAALEALRARMEGLEAWPIAYQRIASVHYTALRRYEPGFYDGRVTLIRTNEGLQRWSVDDETLGWSEIGRDVEVHRVPGRHEEIMNEPHVRAVADVLARLMASRQRRP
jgi:amino acid adenylation domain-containing protein